MTPPAAGHRIEPFADFKSAETLLDGMEKVMRPLLDALDQDTERFQEWRNRTVDKLRNVIVQVPTPLSPAAARPKEAATTADYAGLSYRIAAEFTRFYRQRSSPDDLAAFGRGMLLDVWDAWWRAASDARDRGEALRPSAYMEEAEFGEGRVVDPVLVLEAFCDLDSDVSRILRGSLRDADGALRAQATWQLRRLHQTGFRAADRVVLYELLRLRHWRTARSVDYALPELAVRTVVEAAVSSQRAVENKGETPLAKASEDAFLAADDDENDGERRLTVEVLQLLRSFSLRAPEASECRCPSTVDFPHVAEHIVTTAREAGTTGALDGLGAIELDPAVLRRFLLRVAARSRMIRAALDDLFHYRFPRPAIVPPAQQFLGRHPDSVPGNGHPGCDCWISVLGHRQTGKTWFMASLVAALLPDETPLAAAETPADGQPTEGLWPNSRARVLSSEDFSGARDRWEMLGTAAKRSTGLLDAWLHEERRVGSTEQINHVAEIDTGHMARLRFFDLAGEEVFNPAVGHMGDRAAKLLEDSGPVAAVFMDAETRREEPGYQDTDYVRAAQVMAKKEAPVYVVVNMCDEIVEDYESEAKTEIEESFLYGGRRDRPEECDADYGVTDGPFLALRSLNLSIEVPPTHGDVINRLGEVASLARRPYYQARIAYDLRALGPLFDALWREGRRDISLVYLVCARDGRQRPVEFAGMRALWKDIESRVIESTREDRRRALRALLIARPDKQEEAATITYSKFNDMVGPWKADLRKIDSEAKPPIGGRELGSSSASVASWSKYVRGSDILQTAWNRVTTFLTTREELLGTRVDDSLTEFLLEFGIDPAGKFERLNLDAYAVPFTEAENGLFEKAVRYMVDGLQEQKRESQLEFDDNEAPKAVRRMLGRLIRGFGRAEAEPEGRPTFTIDKGARGPMGSGIGSPVRDRALSYDQRMALSNLTTTFGAAVINRKPEEAVSLVEALYNVLPATETRYANLVLEAGDRDFCHMRMLTEQDKLGDDLDKYRNLAIEVVGRLLEARDRLGRLDAGLVADLAMARALRRALEGVRLPALIALVGDRRVEPDPVAVKDLNTLSTEAAKLVATIAGVKQSISLLTLVGRDGAYRAIWSGDHQQAWKRLDAGSWGAIHTRGGPTREVDRAFERMERGAVLVAKLNDVVKGWGRSDKGNREAVFEVVDGDGACGFDEILAARLVELRLRRRLLVKSYPLLYLVMNDWIGRSCECADGKSLTTIRKMALQNALAPALVKLRAFFAAEFAAAGVGESYTDMGSPTIAKAALEKAAGSAAQDLYDAMGLENDDRDSLWGAC